MTTTTEMLMQDYEHLLSALDQATKNLRARINDAEQAQLLAIDTHYDARKDYNMALLRSEESSAEKRKAEAENVAHDIQKAADVNKVLASSAKDRVKAQRETVDNIKYRIDIKRSLGAMARTEAQLAGRMGET